MRPALVLVDLQRDFLDRPGLEPPESALLHQVQLLLAGCRRRGVPVVHIHTLTRPDGQDRMPHWVREGIVACVAGTPGAAPPAGVAPVPGEAVVAKRFFSGFGNPALATELGQRGCRLLIIAGIYLNGCVQATILDAYQAGYVVWVASDAVGSNEPEHAAHTRRYLDGRAATFLPVAEILARIPPEIADGRDAAAAVAAPVNR